MNTACEREKCCQTKSRCRMTAAQALLKFFSAQMAEQFDGSYEPLLAGIWGIFGHGNVAGIGEALASKNNSIPFYRGQNEQSMAHAAIAYAKAKKCRRIMAVTTSIGPGATNLATAAALAHINRLPLLLLPGDTFASRRPDPVLQQLEDQSCPFISVNDCLKPVSRYFDRIVRVEQLIDTLPRAVEYLLDPARRGPVVLSMPQDLQTEAYSYPSSLFVKRFHPIARPRPDRGELKRAAEAIKTSKRPLIVAGGGCRYSGAEELLGEFVKKRGIPVAETQAGKGALSWRDPMHLGAIGVTGNSSANSIALSSDLILCIGTRLSDFTTASKSLFHGGEKEIIALNIERFDAVKGGATPLVSDAKEGIASLDAELEGYSSQQCYQEEIRREKERWELLYREITEPPPALFTSSVKNFGQTRGAECSKSRRGNTLSGISEERFAADGASQPAENLTEEVNKASPPSPAKLSDAEVVATLNHFAGKEATVVSAAGGLPGELHKLFRAEDSESYHVEYGYSCMGYEIAGGLGVKMAHPNREVYVMVGDGSYLMLHTELLTSLQLGVKINILLLDNRGFGCINRLQKGSGLSPYGNLFPEQTAGVDFAMNAKSYGANAVKVSGKEELKAALVKNRSVDRSSVIVVETDPEKGSPGFAWWDVALPELSEEASAKEARRAYELKIEFLTGEAL